jgi:hypothetical protein
VAQDSNLLVELLTLGVENEKTYKQLNIKDKLLLADISNKLGAPFAKTAFDNFITEFLLTGYSACMFDLSLANLLTVAELY